MFLIRSFAPSGSATVAVVDSLSSQVADRLRATPIHGILVAEDHRGRCYRVVAGGWVLDPEWPRIPARAA